jgi:hypothetical protein
MTRPQHVLHVEDNSQVDDVECLSDDGLDVDETKLTIMIFTRYFVVFCFLLMLLCRSMLIFLIIITQLIVINEA